MPLEHRLAHQPLPPGADCPIGDFRPARGGVLRNVSFVRDADGLAKAIEQARKRLNAKTR